MPKFSPERRNFTLAAAAAATAAVFNPTDTFAGLSQSGTPASQQTNPSAAPSLDQKIQAAMEKGYPSFARRNSGRSGKNARVCARQWRPTCHRVSALSQRRDKVDAE